MYTNLPDGRGFSFVQINPKKLYQGITGYEKFKERFTPFIQADPLAKDMISLEGDLLKYRTEHIHAQIRDSRKRYFFCLEILLFILWPPVFLLLINSV